MARKSISRVTIDEAVAFILSSATYAWGVSIAQVMQFCECSELVAHNCIKAAREAHPGLLEATRDQGFRRRERRWFIDAEHAAAFSQSHMPVPEGHNTRAAERQVVETTTLPTASPRPFADRPGALDFRQWPSRRGNRLVYQDGTVEQCTGPFPHLA